MSREVFIDTASLTDILLWRDRGIVDGVTTNQKIFLSEGRVDFRERVEAICDAVPMVPVSVELTGRGPEALISEATLYASWRPNIVIKVPVTSDGSGLDVIAELSRKGVPTNATVMMIATQLILTVRAGATYVSQFFNRARDAGEDPCLEIARTRRFIDAGRFSSKIIAGSIRSTKDVIDAYDAGADIVTIPPKILDLMLRHTKTDETIKEFDLAWDEFRRANDEVPVLAANGNGEKSVIGEARRMKTLVSRSKGS
jgi:transaldolase